MGVRDIPDSRDGGLAACAAGPATNTMPERRQQPPRRSRAGEQRSESGGGGLIGPLLTLVGIPIGWFVSVVAAMLVITHFVAPDASITLISGLGEQETLWASVAVVGLVTGTMLVRPGTILVGWIVMGILVALAASFVFGWTTLLMIFEALTIGYAVLALFLSVVTAADEGVMAALAVNRWLR